MVVWCSYAVTKRTRWKAAYEDNQSNVDVGSDNSGLMAVFVDDKEEAGSNKIRSVPQKLQDKS